MGSDYPWGMATLRDVQKQMTRQLLLEKGLELFEAKGYTFTTIDDIAAAAGTTRTTFYLHFPSKALLMAELINQVDEILTREDDPPLSTVVELGRRELVRAWLDKKFDQWAVIRPYILAAHQAAPSEPEIDEKIEGWFQDTAAWMQEGLDRAGRFDPKTRQIRCVLAFGQFQYLSMRWFRLGWVVEREICLETLTDAWCHLLTEE
jgi:AcrR family transcriptional regulator